MAPRDNHVIILGTRIIYFIQKREIKVADRIKFAHQLILILEYYPGLSDRSNVIRTLKVEEEGRRVRSA